MKYLYTFIGITIGVILSGLLGYFFTKFLLPTIPLPLNGAILCGITYLFFQITVLALPKKRRLLNITRYVLTILAVITFNYFVSYATFLQTMLLAACTLVITRLLFLLK